MNTIKTYGLGGVALIIALIAMLFPLVPAVPEYLGADGDTNLTNLVLEGDLTVDDDATISGGSLSLTSSNTATSSATVGCIRTYATSTATSVRLVIGSSGATTTHSGTPAVGVVGWQYGTCPN